MGRNQDDDEYENQDYQDGQEDQEAQDSDSAESDADSDSGNKEAAIRSYLAQQKSMPTDAVATAIPVSMGAMNPDARQVAIQNYVMSQNKDKSAIQNALADKKHTDFVANIGDALESFAKANSMAHGGVGVDSGFYQGLKAQGEQGVNQALANKNMDAQDFLKGSAVQNQALKAAYDDPSSSQSKQIISSMQSLYPQQASMFNGLSATQAKTLATELAVKNKMETNAAIKQASLAQASDINESRAKTKADQIANKAYSDASARAAGQRAPEYIKKALVGIGSGKRAMDIINQYSDNPNDMPPQQVSTLDTEITAIAQGGVPNEHGVKSIESKSFESEWNNFLQKVNNKPTGAQLGAFIAPKKEYLEHMMNTNQDMVNGYHKQIYNGLKPQIANRPDLDDKFKQDFPAAFQAPMQTASNAPKSSDPMVKMVSKDGITYSIPQSKIEAARARGWSELSQTAQVGK